MGKTYYTKNGNVIKNPKAYAKTGAPMYETKYEETTNINEPTYIYKLNLEEGNKYIGKTNNLDRRMNQHFSGNGSKVTKKFKPIDGEVIDETYGYFANNIEQKHTKKNIKKYGYDNVRGGSYTNSKTLKTKYNHTVRCANCSETFTEEDFENHSCITKIFPVSGCKRCGNSSHFENECYAKKDIFGNYL